jgi:protoporphyrinogen/coproporphyrinogen III oxidase
MIREVAVGRVAVVGGGAAGLVAALELAEAGVEVVVLEAAPVVGGGLRTVELDGARVDVGVQLVSSTQQALFRTLRRCGGERLLLRAPGHDALWRDGRAHGITYGSVSSMISSGALPFGLKLKLGARYLPFLTTQARELDANDPAATGGAALDGESIARWGQRELGQDFVELLTYPLLAAYYGATPEETAAAIYHAVARVGLDVSVHAARGGFGSVAVLLREAVVARGGTICTGRTVQRVEVGEAQVAIDGEPFQGAVLAVSPPAARALLRWAEWEGRPGLDGWLEGMRARDAVTLALRLDRRLPGDWFGLSFPRDTGPGRQVAVLCAQGRKLDSLVPSGEALLAIPAPAVAPALYEADDQAVIRALLPALDQAVPGVSRRVVSCQVNRFPGGYSLFPPGQLRRLRAFRDEWLPPRLALAGDYLVAPSVEGAVRSGGRAARRLLAGLAEAEGLTRPG